MSDEEKEAVEYFKDDINYLEDALNHPNFLGHFITIRDKEFQMLKILVNLIENQQKEIEKLQIINQMQKYRIEVMDPRELISRDEVKNIITSEIKEIEKFKAENDAKTTNYHLYRIFVDEVLKPLLDKIKGDDNK